jgi:tripartite-type tricarboxylate transporter receptor subunit TctC
MKSHAVGVLFALILASAATAPLHAASYPEQNIIIIVPFPPGGASDTTARLTGNKLSEIVGKPVLIENRAGDLMGGHADVSFQNLGAVAQQIKGGQLKALAVTSDKRADALPDVPTIAEAGVADLIVYSWQAAAAPKGLPAEVRAKLETELNAAANSPDVKKQFIDLGFDVVATTGAQFADFLKAEVDRWKTVVETGKITVE